VPVAEYAAAQIILANKGYFQTHERYRKNGWEQAVEYADHFAGNYGGKVGLLGAGTIGRHVIKLLAPYELTVLVYDPYLSPEDARKLNAVQAGLDEIFASCSVISNHIANNDRTKGMLGYSLFSKMGDYATFINTGRGEQLIQADLVRALLEKPTRTALLDVTDPEEPLPDDSPLLRCPNAYVTPHRAGSVRDEKRRMGKYMREEYGRIGRGEAPLYEVTEDMLLTMA
jgi:phosphoglycerate dehydrogenase-like enzyme